MRIEHFAVAALMGAFGVSAQPSINANGIVNAASYSIPGLPNSAIAQGSIFAIFGTNLGPSTLQQAGAFPLPTNLGGTTVTIKAGSQTFQAPIIYAIATQVAAILPSTVPVGTVSATVSYQGNSSSAQTFNVATSSFGTFAVNQQGSGTGVLTNANYQPYLPTYAAMPGDVVILWGTGLGPISTPDGNGPSPGNLTNIPAVVYVGNTAVTPSYRGRSGCCAGLDQVVFTMPSGITGCSVPVTVTIGDVVGQTTTTPITTSSNRICEDPTGLPSSVLQTLQSKGTLKLGFIGLSRSTTTNSLPASLGGGTSSTDIGSAVFSQYTPLTLSGSGGSFSQAAIGSCTVDYYSGNTIPLSALPQGLDAGPVVNVNGPLGTKQLTTTAMDKGTYFNTLSSGATLYLNPGSYTVSNGSGGVDVGGFSTSLTVGQPLTWTNQTAITASPIQRSKGVTVNWSGGAAGTYTVISGASIVSSTSSTGTSYLSAVFVCIAPVAAGTFTVGPNVLLQLPASSTLTEQGITISLGELAVGNISNPVSFTAPGLDYGYASWSSTSGATVSYQ